MLMGPWERRVLQVALQEKRGQGKQRNPRCLTLITPQLVLPVDALSTSVPTSHLSCPTHTPRQYLPYPAFFTGGKRLPTKYITECSQPHGRGILMPIL